jgi:hypothetical protein
MGVLMSVFGLSVNFSSVLEFLYGFIVCGSDVG